MSIRLGAPVGISNGAIVGAPRASGLRRGDRILSIDGDTRIQIPRLAPFALPHWRLGTTTLRLEVASPDGPRPVVLPIASGPAPGWVVVLHLSVSAAFAALGIVLAWKRPELRIARIGWFTSMLCAVAFLALTLNILWGRLWAIPTSLALLSLVLPWHKVAGYWFFTAFPSEKPQSTAWRILTLTVLATAPLYWLLTIPFNLGIGSTGELYWWVHSLPDWFLRAGRTTEEVMSPFLSLATCAVLVRAYWISTAEERRRIAWVVAATSITLIWTAGALFLSHMGWSRSGLPVNIANSTVLLIPLSIGYAITRHQVFGIKVAVRRGVQYLLARGVLEAAIVGPMVAIAVLNVVRPELRIGELIHPAYAAFVFVAIPGMVFRQRILRAVDRQFFRPAYDEEQILSGVTESIRSQVDFRETEVTVARHIRQALHPESLAILYRTERESRILPGGPPEGGAISGRLEAARTLLITPALRQAVSPEERAWLEHTGAALIVPVPGDLRFRGLLLLGPKKSEEPYTAAERKLLETVAAQMAVAHENYCLANERISAVLAERNRIARELHDGFAQGFAGIQLHLQSAEKTIQGAPAQALLHVQQARHLARVSMAEARRSVHELRRSAEGSDQLVDRLRELAARLSAECVVKVTVDAPPLPDLPEEVSSNLFRIAQESITNALKHASPTRIVVSVSVEGTRVQLRVCDNGCGFDSGDPPARSYGLRGMRERARLIRGEVEIRSRAGQGTEVVAQVDCP